MSCLSTMPLRRLPPCRDVARLVPPEDQNLFGFSFRQASRSPVPSLERLKPFEGGGEDDDDGLDKNLWAVVEKGSMCTAPDCVYRDAVSGPVRE